MLNGSQIEIIIQPKWFIIINIYTTYKHVKTKTLLFIKKNILINVCYKNKGVSFQNQNLMYNYGTRREVYLKHY